MNKLTMIVLYVMMAALLSMCSCSNKRTSATGATAATEKNAVTVSTRTIAPQELDDYIEFGGTVCAVSSVAVLPSVAGKITRLTVTVGDRVSKGQLIAQVDPSKPGAEFALSPVRASASGTVTAVPVSEGAYVTTSATVAEITDTDTLEITVNVSERFVPLVTFGQRADVTFKAIPDERFAATVTRLSPLLDPATRTMQATLKLAEPRGVIKAGMFAHVTLVTAHKAQVLAVPTRAIIYSNGKPHVFVVQHADDAGVGSSGSAADGASGMVASSGMGSKSGLTVGDAVVVKGQNMISDGQRINAVEAD